MGDLHQKLVAITQTAVIVDFRTLSAMNGQILPPTTCDEYPFISTGESAFGIQKLNFFKRTPFITIRLVSFKTKSNQYFSKSFFSVKHFQYLFPLKMMNVFDYRISFIYHLYGFSPISHFYEYVIYNTMNMWRKWISVRPRKERKKMSSSQYRLYFY